MAKLDKVARSLAQNMLFKFAKSITYTKVIEGTYNPATSEVETTSTDYQIKGLFQSVSSGDITSGLADSTDIKILIAALDIEEPTTKDIIDNKYTVSYIKPHYSGDLVAYFELICKVR